MTEQDNIVGSSKQAVSSGLNAILEVEGMLQPLKRVPGKKFEGAAEDKVVQDQVEVSLTEAVIREMEGSIAEPELKDDTFKTWINYAPPGQLEPSKQGKFNQVFMKSAEKLWADRGEPDKGWRDLVSTRVVLRKQLRKYKIDGNPVDSYCFGFIEGKENPVDIDAHVAKLIEGKDKASAVREIMMDSKAKRDPKYKEATKIGAPIAGMELVDGTYQKASQAPRA
jgi:hypothetical protein